MDHTVTPLRPEGGEDSLIIAGVTLASRLFIGTAGYPTQAIMRDAVQTSGADVVTASIRRVSLQGHGSDTVTILKLSLIHI